MLNNANIENIDYKRDTVNNMKNIAAKMKNQKQYEPIKNVKCRFISLFQ